MKRVWIMLAGATVFLAAQAPRKLSPPVTFTAEQDHQDMMDRLGIKALRPEASGDEKAPNHANYEERLANPYPDLPDVLTCWNGQRVVSADMWWNERRPEVVEEFEREVYGRLPGWVPKVSWRIASKETRAIGSISVISKRLIGHVNNSSYPYIDVNLSMELVTPENAKRPAAVLMMFGRSVFPANAQLPPGVLERIKAAFESSTEQLIANGWGYALIDPRESIQADNAAGLTRGIIGLVNKGQPRKPDQWGALRAWAWGAARGLDYLETDASVDPKHVGIEGVSRYGKAALITLAFEQRFAMGLIGSSGEGGAKLFRRNFGEGVENLTDGEYYWMAGNFMKYGASQAVFGSRNARDLPVDAHELIALCAPRLTFISYGVPEQGDAKWLDQRGSFMAAVAAGAVFKLLGAKDLGLGNNYQAAEMPRVSVGLLEGQLAWRQHDGGHTDAPNMKYFIQWADKFLRRSPE